MRGLVHRFGFDIVPVAPVAVPTAVPPDFDPFKSDVVKRVRPYTMTPAERIGTLVLAVRYVVAAGIRGSIAECGVWRGGSVMAAALTLMSLGETERDIYLFDTWQGMPAPSDRDVDVWGRPAARLFSGPNSAHEIADLANLGRDETEKIVKSTGHPAERLHFVEGFVEVTLPRHAPG